MSRLLRAVGCLNQATWPTDALDRALFGEKHVASICQSLDFALALCTRIWKFVFHLECRMQS